FVPMFWEQADGRTTAVREIQRRIDVLQADCGADSIQKKMLCQQAVFLHLQLETQQRVALETGKFDASVFTQMSNALLGLLKSLGLDRKTKKVEDLATVLREHGRK